jgi:RNA polymerase sigma-70 factor (ECF subfamily)
MSDGAPRDAAEEQILACCRADDISSATTLALERYGAEIMGFLVARLRDHDLASEAFSRFAHDLWRGIAGFQGRSSVRVWAYVLARHAASRVIEHDRRHHDKHIPLSEAEHISKVAAAVRTETLQIIRTATRDRLTQLRDRLSADDRSLLILRVNEGMEWKDVALVMTYDGGEPSAEVLRREAARLRKRFQLVKERLREMARAEGLLGDGD